MAKVALTNGFDRDVCLPVRVSGDDDEMSQLVGYKKKTVRLRGHSALYYYFKYEGVPDLGDLNTFFSKIGEPMMTCGDIIRSTEGTWKIIEEDGVMLFDLVAADHVGNEVVETPKIFISAL